MMKDNTTDELSPEKAKLVLGEDGIDVTIDEAKIILDFLYLISEIVVDQYLNPNDSL